MNKISLLSQIVSIVIIFFLLIFGFFAREIFVTQQKSLYLLEKEKTNIVMDVLSPSMVLNLEFGLSDNIKTSLEQLLSSNNYFVGAKFIDLTSGDVIFDNLPTTKEIIKTTKILKDDTFHSVGELTLVLSNEYYKQAVRENNIFIIRMILIFIIFLFLFVVLLKFLFKPLETISKKLATYSPQNQSLFDLEMIDGKNEVTVINNTVVSLIDKIEEYTKEMLQANKDLEFSKNKAEESTRFKSEFLANMSHEIRTPMNGIIGMTHLCLQTRLTQQQTTYMQNIDNSAKQLLSLINGILDLSKIEAGKLNIEKIYFNFYNTINNILILVENQAKKKGISLKLKYDLEKNAYYFGDELRITQIIINLCSNAIKFTEKGSVSIIISKLEDDMLRVEVKDTGIGLSEDEQIKLFHNFIQADGSTTRKYGGTGLGLSISKQLVELMGGNIWIESEKDKGSSFIFSIVLKEVKSIKDNIIEDKSSINDIVCLKGSRILLVEDDKINQEIVAGLLDDSGIKMDISNNGKEAVEMFSENSYDLILMDYEMPLLNGLEATKLIRIKDKNIPIIAFSANVMKEEILKIRDVGMDDVLVKPIDTNKFYNILLKYISKKVKIDKKEIFLLVDNKRDALFKELAVTLETMQPKRCDIVVQKIQKYKLSDKDNILFQEIKKMIEDFEFEEASETLKGKL